MPFVKKIFFFAFYPLFRVLPFVPLFRVLPSFPRFTLCFAFPRFTLYSAFYPLFRFSHSVSAIPLPPFRFRVLPLPQCILIFTLSRKITANNMRDDCIRLYMCHLGLVKRKSIGSVCTCLIVCEVCTKKTLCSCLC